MGNIFQYFYQVFFALLLLLIFVLAIVFILQFDNPYRKIKKRRTATKIAISTLLVSYIIYLGVFFVLFYLICFAEQYFETEMTNIEYFTVFLTFIVPNIFMGFRKTFKWRMRYYYRLIHYIMAAINFGLSFYLLHLLIKYS